MSYPKPDDGQVVMVSAYERIAWATAGSSDYCLPTRRWVEIGLAFGIPILGLFFLLKNYHLLRQIAI